MAVETRIPLRRSGRVGAAAVAFALVVSSLPADFAAAAPAGPQSFGSGPLGGGFWSDEVRVTFSPADDYAPQLSFDSNRQPNLLWTRAGGTDGDLYYARLTAFGDVDHPETYIRALVGGYPPMVAPRAPQAALDSEHNIHYVFDNASREVIYAKYSENGTLLQGERVVGTADGFWSILPAVAVQKDDFVHIAHSEYRFRCEDIAYDKLTNNGTGLWTNRIVSQDIVGVSEGALIKADRFNGDLLFTFGTQNGSFAGRYSKYGGVYIPSHQFRVQNDFKVADIAEAPNGSLHIVWEDAGSLYYTRVLSNDSKQVDALRLVNSAAVAAFPRIEAAADGSVAIAWSDNRTGTPQVWAGRLAAQDAPSSFAPYQVSNSTGGATDPALAIDPGDDRIALAWADASGGNREITFKRELGCGVKLWVDPLLAPGEYLHPNKTKTTTLHVLNTGWFRDRMTVLAEPSVYDQFEGWLVSVDPQQGYDLDPGEEGVYLLSVATPGNATNGEDLWLLLNATNAGPPPCFDTDELSASVQVARSLDLRTESRTLSGPSGSAVRFNMTVENTGDRQETFASQRFGASPDAVMSTNFSFANATLAPGGIYNFTLDVGIPAATQGTYSESVRIRIFATTDGFVYDGLNLVVGVDPSVELYLLTDAATLYPDPGALVTFFLIVYLGGNLPVQVGLSTDHGSGASFNVTTLSIAPGENRAVAYSWSVPEDAEGGERFTLLVSATSSRLGVVVTQELTVIVNSICDFQISPPSEPTVVGVNATAIPVLAWNRGNVPLALTPSVAQHPTWWTLSVDYAGLTGPTVTVGRDQTWTTFLIVSTPASTSAGVYGVTLHYETVTCGGADALVQVEVPAHRAWKLTANATSALLSPGGSATFDVTLQNLGNLDLDFEVSALSDEPAFAVWLSFVAGSPPVELGDATVAPITLSPLAIAHLQLRTQVRGNAAETSGELSVAASAGGLEASVLRFQVAVGRSNLFPFNAFLVPAAAVEGDNLSIVLKVGNRGTAPSIGGTVRLAVDNEIVQTVPFGPLAVDEDVDIVVNWTARPGEHHLIVQVQEAAGGTENNLTDNQREWSIEVAAAPPAPPQRADYSGIALAALAGGGAAAMGLFLLRRQRAHRPVRHESPAPPPPKDGPRPPGNP